VRYTMRRYEYWVLEAGPPSDEPLEPGGHKVIKRQQGRTLDFDDKDPADTGRLVAHCYSRFVDPRELGLTEDQILATALVEFLRMDEGNGRETSVLTAGLPDCVTLRQLTELSEPDLLAIRGVGPATVRYVASMLRRIGLTLRGEPPIKRYMVRHLAHPVNRPKHAAADPPKCALPCDAAMQTARTLARLWQHENYPMGQSRVIGLGGYPEPLGYKLEYNPRPNLPGEFVEAARWWLEERQ
jgi:hypothetical protein